MKGLPSILIISAGLILTGHAEAQQGASATLFASSCNIIQQNVSATGASTIINEIDCRPDGPPEKSFRLRYIWLDATTASILVGGYFPASLKKILGKEPLIIKNEVFSNVDEIVQTLGRRVSKDDALFEDESFFGVAGNKISGLDDYGAVPVKSSGFGSKKTELQKTLKIYQGDGQIPWPDVGALDTVINSTRWPASYKIAYGRLESLNFSVPQRKDADNKIIACVRMTKSISREDLDNYWQNMGEATRFALKNKATILQDYSAVDAQSKKFTNINISAMKYFGKYNWPTDFVIAEGAVLDEAESCSGFDINFVAKTRSLHVLVAVLEPEGRSLDIAQLNFLRDGAQGLRLRHLGEEKTRSEDGVISLKRGDSVIIPLRVELRSSDSLPKTDESQKSLARIAAAPYERFALSGEDPQQDGKESTKSIVYLRKDKSAFRPPESFILHNAYTFGPALDLQSIVVSGGYDVALRSAPANALSFIGTLGLGSCPFLYVSDDEGKPPISLGRVLIGASSKSLERSQTIKLPQGATDFYLSEEEPEISFVASVKIKNTTTGETQELGSQLTIFPNNYRRFLIPKRFPSRSEIIIQGYYRTLGSLIADGR